MNTARRMRVVLDESGAARRRPAGWLGIVALVVGCALLYVVGALVFGGHR